MRTLAILVFVLLMAPPATSLVSQITTAGTEFWLAYQENLNLLFNDDPVFTVVVRTDQAATGNIEAAATGATIPFSVPAGVTELDLFAAVLYPAGSDVTSNFGIRVTSDVPIQLSAFHYRSFFCEASVVYPTTELGTAYRVTTPTDIPNNGQPNSFVVAATEDNTQIEIIPTALTLGLFPADQPIDITLNRGQTYQVQSNGDLTNSSVISTSGEPIAVFAGAREANMDENCSGGANSHVWDQVPPIDHFDDLYYFVPFNNQNGDIIKILALEDDTELYFDCDLEATLAAGEYYRIFLNQPTVISATGPVSLSQYNTEGGCNANDYGDPNGLNYLPASLRSNEYRWFATDRTREVASPTYFVEHAISVIAPLAAQNDIQLDGAPLGGFTPFAGDPNMVYRRLTVSGGPHIISSSGEPIQVYAYGFNDYDAYTLNLGYEVNDPVNFLCGCDPSSGTSSIAADVGCPGETTTFEFSTTYPELGAFYWVVEGDTLFDEIFVYEYIFDNPGDYIIEVVVLTIDGCIYPYDTLITVENCTDPCFGFEPSPIFEIPGAICVDSLVPLSLMVQNDVGVIDSIRWLSADPAVRVFGDSVNLTFEQTGVVDFVVSFFLDNGCVFDYAVSLTVTDCSDRCTQNPPTVEVFGEAEYCIDDLVTFEAVVSSDTNTIVGPPIWTSLLTGETVEDYTVATNYEETGVYPWRFSFTLDNGCSYVFDSLAIITVQDCDTTLLCPDPPELELVQRVEPACVDSLLFLDLLIINANGPALDSVVYDAGDGRRFTGESWVDLTYSTPGEKNVRADYYRSDGCVFSENLTFTVADCPPDTITAAPSCSLYWPTAFSPNLDGNNDAFRPFFAPECRPLNFQLSIYNRWGGQLYESTDPENGWDGTSRGALLNPGVYVYLATYEWAGGQMTRKSGAFTLLR